MMSKAPFGIVILAAGTSSRLGRPKQLLSFQGKTLLQHSITIAEATTAEKVVVVLGAHSERIQATLMSHRAEIITNPEFYSGMGTSIQYGLNHLLQKNKKMDGVLLMVCDQPYLSISHLENLVSAQKNAKALIAASRYQGILGVPAFFHQSVFPDLLQLEGDRGAKPIIQKHLEQVVAVDFPLGEVDIDTEEDYNKLKNKRF